MSGDAPKAVGGSIRSLCTKCKKATRHIIVSVVGAEAARVQCVTCDGIHNYRDPAPKSPARREQRPATGRARRSGSRLPSLEEEWLAQMHGRDPKRAIPYGSETRPAVGDLLEHPTFGFGLIRKVIPPNKVEVHFREGFRLLRWGS